MKSLIPGFFLKQGAVLVAILFAIVAFTVMPFSSCSTAPTNTNMSASTVDTADDDDPETRRRSSGSDNDEPDNCDEDEGDPCKDDEYCEGTCEIIYTKQDSVRSCKNRGDETVGMLETVHDRLMGKNAGVKNKFKDRDKNRVKDDLQEITDDEDDIGHDELKCYLQIGSSKYIDQIKDGLTDEDLDTPAKKLSAVDRLHETLKWMVEDTETAQVLYDINRGPSIVQALLEKLEDLRITPDRDSRLGNYVWQCLGHNDFKRKGADKALGWSGSQTATDRNNNIEAKKNAQNLDQALWWLDSDTLRIWHYDSTATPKGQEGTIQSIDKDLYTALSCFHLINGENNNIFTYSAEEGNENMFNIAFELLKTIGCEDVDDEDRPGCARALMCWSSWQKKCYETRDAGDNGGPDCGDSANHADGRDRTTEKLWDMAKDHESDLIIDDGSKYHHCNTKDFYDFFK